MVLNAMLNIQLVCLPVHLSLCGVVLRKVLVVVRVLDARNKEQDGLARATKKNRPENKGVGGEVLMEESGKREEGTLTPPHCCSWRALSPQFVRIHSPASTRSRGSATTRG
jgi:hypothetical protein